jgi:hypothetical protein
MALKHYRNSHAPVEVATERSCKSVTSVENSPNHRLATAHSYGLIVAVVAFMCVAPVSGVLAAITVTKANGTAVPEGSFTVSHNAFSDGYDIHLLQLYAQWSETVYEIHANGGETIDNVFIEIDGPSAGSPLTVRLRSDLPGGLRTVRNIVQLGNAETQLLNVNCFEDIGSVEVEVIGTLVAGRDVIGPIISSTPDNAVRGVTWVQAGRDVLGDVTANLGRIGLVWAQRYIGTAADPISIHCKHGITQIAGDEVFATINSRLGGGSGGLWSFTADRFTGSMNIEKIVFNTSGGVDGRIVMRELFDGVISLGKSYTSAAQYIELPVSGLGGQIVINADAVSGGSWTAPVRIGPQGSPQQVVLTGPRYNYTSESLGGGSVGLVPFRLHDQSCSPANGGVADVLPGGKPLTVSLRHFGPVTFTPTAGAPVTIERRTAGTQNAFVAVSAAQFSFSIGRNNSRALKVTAAADQNGFEPGYEYRIRPTSVLRSDVPALPGVLWDADYQIVVQVPPCDGDVNSTGQVNVDDLLLIIAFWGQANPIMPRADVNSDGIVNVDDLLALINNWGSCW